MSDYVIIYILHAHLCYAQSVLLCPFATVLLIDACPPCHNTTFGDEDKTFRGLWRCTEQCPEARRAGVLTLRGSVTTLLRTKLRKLNRNKFNTRNRAPGETVAAYVAALREIAEHCNYGTSLSEMLRDRLVCGVNHDGIQKKLLAEKELDFDKAYSVAVAIEVAERDTKNLKAECSHSNPVLYSHSKERGKSSSKMSSNKSKGEITCYRCGGNQPPCNCVLSQGH